MIKLATPILYENALNGLNQLRPLQLKDKSRLTLDYSVLCNNPVGINKPIIGRLARCTEQGAISKKVLQGFSTYELFSFILNGSNPQQHIGFSGYVKGVLICCYNAYLSSHFGLYTDDYGSLILTINPTIRSWVNFKCKDLYLKGTGYFGWTVYGDIYGMY